jgi:hypothetical protein
MAGKSITVSVSRRILHIGDAAYPLANIARVQAEPVKFIRGPAIRRFIIQTVTWIALGAAATFAIKYAVNHDTGGLTHDSQQQYLAIVRIAAGALIGLSLLRLLSRLVPTWRRQYALIIETAGMANAVIINPNRALITDLVGKITHALENPDQAYVPPTVINNFTNNNYGHQNAQFGARSTMSVS